MMKPDWLHKGSAMSRLPATRNIALDKINGCLAITITDWMRKHGKVVRPKLTSAQKQQMQACFKLMDEDGSGAIDAGEMSNAFKLLGLKLKHYEIKAMLDAVDTDGSGEVGYPAFVEIMTNTLLKLGTGEAVNRPHSGTRAPRNEEPGVRSTHNVQALLDFKVTTTAYRRKKMIEVLETGEREEIAGVIQSASEAAAETSEIAGTEAPQATGVLTRRAAYEAVRRSRLQSILSDGTRRRPSPVRRGRAPIPLADLQNELAGTDEEQQLLDIVLQREQSPLLVHHPHHPRFLVRRDEGWRHQPLTKGFPVHRVKVPLDRGPDTRHSEGVRLLDHLAALRSLDESGPLHNLLADMQNGTDPHSTHPAGSQSFPWLRLTPLKWVLPLDRKLSNT